MWSAAEVRMGMASIGAIMLALAVPAAAQDQADKPAKLPTVERSAAPSPNATINLINLLVKQGVLSEEQAAALIKQADDEAYVARQAVRDAATKAEGAEKRAASAADAVSPPGTKRVTYVPEIVKQQIREDIKKEVMAKAEKENWASPGKYPEWAQRIHFFGDVRVRYEADLFPPGNSPSTAVNYNAINTGLPYNTLGGTSPNANPYFWPTYDTDKNRNRPQLMARLGMEADLSEGFWAGFRIGTGDSSTPVSFNHFEGGAGGNFSKPAIWLDRAFIKYNPVSNLTVYAGRFDNPFFTANDLVYYRDLAFDGFATQVNYEVWRGITPFVVAGAFPIFNTNIDAGSSFDFTNEGVLPGKAPSNDKWMFGGQLGSNVHVVPEVDFTFAGAYYDFTAVQGQLSNPCFVFGTQDFCSTDLNRPMFAQRGNTYMALRNIVPQLDASRNSLPLYQYFGLASAFRDVTASLRLDLGQFDPVHIILDGEYVRNVAWNYNDIAAKVLANPLPNGATSGCIVTSPGGTCSTPSVYAGGPQGWQARLTVGDKELRKLWDWNAYVGYKWLESDAVIDAFTDSEFGLGGTNLKGYFVGARLALGPSVWLSAKWMSANQVAGAPYAVDIFLLDLNARF